MTGPSMADLVRIAYGGPLDETTYRRQAEDFARETLGYAHWHAGNVRTAHGGFSQQGQTGWPDDVFLRPPRFVAVEFKGPSTPFDKRGEQKKCLNLLRACGLEVFVWRSGTVTLEEIANYLMAKLRPSCPWSDPAVIGPW